MRKNTPLTPEKIKELKEQEKKEKLAEKDSDSIDIFETVKFNMLIIRELYDLIASQESSKIEFEETGENYTPVTELALYLFLDTLKDNDKKGSKLKKCQDKYSHMLYDTPYILNEVSHKLISCGISPEYVTADENITIIDVDSDIEQLIKNYLASLKLKRKNNKKTDDITDDILQEIKNKYKYLENGEVSYYSKLKTKNKEEKSDIPKVLLKTIQPVLHDYYDRIYNLDGSLLIDSIKRLVLESKKYVADRDFLSEIGVEISNIQLDNYYTNASTKKIYSYYAKQLAEKNPEIPNVNPVRKDKVNLIENSNNIISHNFFIVRELYLILAELENITDALDKFYSILDIPQNDYESIIQTDSVTDFEIINKLVRFNFPVSIFRKDNLTYLPMRKNLEYLIQDYFINNDYDEFYTKLKLEMIYTNYEENAVLFMLVYNILKAVIEEEDTHWSDLVTKYPDLLTKEFKL